MAKPIKGVIEDWTIRNTRIIGTEIFNPDRGAFTADICTSDIIQIFNCGPLRICETRNSFYVLIGDPQQ